MNSYMMFWKAPQVMNSLTCFMPCCIFMYLLYCLLLLHRLHVRVVVARVVRELALDEPHDVGCTRLCTRRSELGPFRVVSYRNSIRTTCRRPHLRISSRYRCVYLAPVSVGQEESTSFPSADKNREFRTRKPSRQTTDAFSGVKKCVSVYQSRLRS